MDRTRATVIVAQHGQSELTLQCLQTLREHHGAATPMVVVDDGSRREDANAIANCGIDNHRLFQQQHRGVTAAWNAGAAVCTTDVLIFLNNDVLTAGQWIERLVDSLQDERTVVAGVALRAERHVPHDVLLRLPSRRFVEGWCFAVRREDFNAIGGFRNSLRLYFSDTDLQCRLLERAGRGSEGLAVIPGVPLKHLGHQTTRHCATRTELWQADRRRFIRHWSH